MSDRSRTNARPTVTAVVTSYKRFDLLEKTLASFVQHNTFPIDELIIIEDSAEDGVYAVESVLGNVPRRIILNGTNLGQISSIDRAYADIQSDYIFHMEDDWLFTRPGFIEGAIAILEKEPNVILVTVRDDEDMPRYVRSLKTRETETSSYKRTFPELHFLWHTFTFNPSLRRTADYKALPNGYKGVGDEASLSRYYKGTNRDMAWLIGGGVQHTGDERSNYGSGWGYRKSPPGTKIKRFFRFENLHKWRESLRRKFWHWLRLMGIDTESMQRKRRP